MIQPTRNNFFRTAGKNQQVWCGSFIHPNPKLYKYYFQVYTPDLPWEGSDFFENAPRLCAAELKTLMDQFRAERRSCFIYNVRRPRAGATPFDRSSERWRDVPFAPAWENDPDPEVDGVK